MPMNIEKAFYSRKYARNNTPTLTSISPIPTFLPMKCYITHISRRDGYSDEYSCWASKNLAVKCVFDWLDNHAPIIGPASMIEAVLALFKHDEHYLAIELLNSISKTVSIKIIESDFLGSAFE